jgi:hypothetical protein
MDFFPFNFEKISAKLEKVLGKSKKKTTPFVDFLFRVCKPGFSKPAGTGTNSLKSAGIH